MARELSDEQHEDLAQRLLQHTLQVEAGVIPADSPPDFVRPEGDAALDSEGHPWWWGPGWKPDETTVDLTNPDA